MSGALASCCQLAEYALDSDECKAVLEMDFVRPVEILMAPAYRGRKATRVSGAFRFSAALAITCYTAAVLHCTTAAHSVRSIPGPLFVS